MGYKKGRKVVGLELETTSNISKQERSLLGNFFIF